MENVLDIGSASYEAAEPMRNVTFYEKFLFFMDLLVDILKVIVLSVPHWFVAIYRLFVSPAKKSVAGQTVLVTGGGNGIGKEIAIRFAGEGCNIAIADVDFQAAQRTAKELSEANVKIIVRAYHVDITDTDQIRTLRTNIEKDMPPVDILVNNAGIVPMLSLREGTDKEVERIVQVNITAQFHMTRTFLKGMIDRKRGHIVGIASISAIHPISGAIIYAATKSSIHTFMVALNEEMRQEGNECIKCTSILPYLVSTRKDLVEAVNFRFPLITPKYTAKMAVDATLRNELMVTIPRSQLSSTQWFSLLPLAVQQLIRDHILREKGRRLFTDKRNISVSQKEIPTNLKRL